MTNPGIGHFAGIIRAEASPGKDPTLTHIEPQRVVGDGSAVPASGIGPAPETLPEQQAAFAGPRTDTVRVQASSGETTSTGPARTIGQEPASSASRDGRSSSGELSAEEVEQLGDPVVGKFYSEFHSTGMLSEESVREAAATLMPTIDQTRAQQAVRDYVAARISGPRADDPSTHAAQQQNELVVLTAVGGWDRFAEFQAYAATDLTEAERSEVNEAMAHAYRDPQNARNVVAKYVNRFRFGSHV